MIGLLDFDLQSSTSITSLIPNLEIMKLAAYYRLEENKFCRLLDLGEQELTSYEQIYVFSEVERPPEIPEAYKRANNVIYGGTAFTNGIYVPFKNELIDYTLPKPLIYKDFLKQKYQDGIKTKTINHVLDDTYYRNYAGNNKLPIPAVTPRKRVILYDRNFFYPDWEDTIANISERNPSSIYRIHPIVCSNLTQFFTARSLSKLARANTYILDINIPLSEVDYMIKHYENRFKAEITKSTEIYLPLGGKYKTNKQYYKDFVYKLNLLYSFWARDIPIKMKYMYPGLEMNNPLPVLSQSVATWTQGETCHTKMIIDRFPKDKSLAERRPIKLEWEELLKYEPAAKPLAYKTYDMLKEGGIWRL